MTLKDRSAYRRLMDAVVVTPELEERVLEAVARRAERRPVIPAARRRILTARAAAGCCVVRGVGPPVPGEPPGSGRPAGGTIPNRGPGGKARAAGARGVSVYSAVFSAVSLCARAIKLSSDRVSWLPSRARTETRPLSASLSPRIII